MKIKKYMLLVAGLVLSQGIASAEMLTGTVTNIDMTGQKLTLRRIDNNANVTIKVKNAQALQEIQPGEQVTLEANKKLFGGWETDSLNAPADASINSEMSASQDASAAQPAPSGTADASASSAY